MVKDPYIRIYNHIYSHADIANADGNKLQAEILVPNKVIQRLFFLSSTDFRRLLTVCAFYSNLIVETYGKTQSAPHLHYQ